MNISALPGRLDEIGPDDLRFDVADTVALIERVRAGSVDEAAVRRLVRHTGGWPAVTYLTVHALAAGADLPSADATECRIPTCTSTASGDAPPFSSKSHCSSAEVPSW